MFTHITYITLSQILYQMLFSCDNTAYCCATVFQQVAPCAITLMNVALASVAITNIIQLPKHLPYTPASGSHWPRPL